MRYVRLGRSNIEVSELCLGTMMFGGKTSRGEGVRILHRAVDEGINFVDTASTYCDGKTEEIVGDGLRGGKRDRVFLATKIKVMSRRDVFRVVERSLGRLGTNHIDMLYVHWPFERMNLEELLAAFDALQRQGKILYTACSNFPAWLAVRCLWIQDRMGYEPFVCGQYPYSLLERGVETEVLPMARATGMGVVAYRPLFLGVLTGKYIGETPSGSRGAKDKRVELVMSRYREGVVKLRDFARARGYDAADAANAWVRSHPVLTGPIVGISSVEQFEANLKGFEWEMTPEERDEVTGFFPHEDIENLFGEFPKWRRRFDILVE